MSIGRRQYPFDLIEPKWQAIWDRQRTFHAWNPGETLPHGHPFAVRHKLEGKTATPSELPPKYYVLDMFPYPSGAGLHVGHPEGYTATDILARYRRAAGFNVLHPMGWDAFGLPAEQYAIKTGQHPRATTEANIANFKRQIQSLGFSYDWSREVDTTDLKYFKWTQWIFLKLYNSWFNPETNKAEPIEMLKYPPEVETASVGRESTRADSTSSVGRESTRADSTASPQQDIEAARRNYRDSHRLAYVAEAPVNWCPELGTVLANEEVIDGKSEVGGFPVVRKPMRQWMLRITAYAERLLNDLNSIDWTHSLKEMQRNWIGRSEGAHVEFQVEGTNHKITVFTTRPDTLFGATYMVLAPEHHLAQIETLGGIVPVNAPANLGTLPFKSTFASETFANGVHEYQLTTIRKSELERTELAKEKSGQFTGAYAINPVNSKRIPIYIADYVLASYGSGAIMAVPAHDERDFEFAKKFQLPIRPILGIQGGKVFSFDATKGYYTEGEKIQSVVVNGEETLLCVYYDGCVTEDGIAVNSSNSEISLNGLPTSEAKAKITAWLEEKGLGKKTINYKLRDWLFSRQRYWGEPFPIIWKRDPVGNLYHEALPESALPLLPPSLADYRPAPDGQPPLARAKDWVNLPDGSVRETNTMPQWAGSCWYYLRFLDAQNENQFVGEQAEQYWMGTSGASTINSTPSTKSTTPGVDLYVGGTEHAVLHLLYARFWHKVLFDLGYVSTPEPFFKLVNQGLILGEDGQKMSKSRGNVVNPDDILKDYGADAFRLYEMFLGPLEMVKPWNTKGVEGVYRFLGRVWRLFVDEKSETEFEQSLMMQPGTDTLPTSPLHELPMAETPSPQPSPPMGAREKNQANASGGQCATLLDKIKLSPAIADVEPTPAQLKALHACIKKVTEDLDALRFNTAISALMVFNNEAMTWEMKPRAVLREFLILLQPFAPHLAEELWTRLHGTGNAQGASSLAYEPWPKYDAALLVESTIEMPVQVNGKLRAVIIIPADATSAQIEAAALACEKIKPFIEGKTIKKIIIVPKRMVNIAVG